MARYCPNCKSEVSAIDIICPHCGAKLEWEAPLVGNEQAASAENNQTQPAAPQGNISSNQEYTAPQQEAPLKSDGTNEGVNQNAPKKGGKKWLKVIIGFMVISSLCSFCRNSSPEEDQKAASSAPQAAQSVQRTESEKAPAPAPAPKPKDKRQEKLDKTRDAISSIGVKGNVMASSYVSSDRGFMAVVDRDFMIFDVKNHQYAIIENTNCIRDFTEKVKQKERGSIVLRLAIPYDSHDQDEKAGYWEGNVHHIPFRVVWDYENNTPVDNGIFTGTGKDVSRYETYLYEPKNVTLAHIFLSDAILLVNDMK